MNLNGWADGAWADGSWVAASWGESEAAVVAQVVYGDGDFSWQSHVKALNEQRSLEGQIKVHRAEIKKVERKIRKVEKQLAKPEHPKGILANLFLLEETKLKLEAKVQEAQSRLIALDWLIEAVEIDDDEEEVMFLVS